MRSRRVEAIPLFRVVVTKPLPEKVEQYLSQYAEVDTWWHKEPLTQESLIHLARDADAIITASMRMDDAILSQLPKLKCVSTTSVGYDHFDTEAFKRHEVLATHTPEVLDETVADLTFALMLGAARRIVELDDVVRSGEWGRHPESWYYGTDVHHRTLGIIGMGRIGEAVARRAKLGFGMDVLYHNRSRKPLVESELGVTYVEFEELLSRADFVVLLTPLTTQTRGLMNRDAFAKMKSSAIFVNVSRGATVDEDALYEALSTGVIRGAGLDVFVQEPTPIANPILTLNNVVLLPHIGSATRSTRDDMAMLGARNVVAVLEGRFDDARVIPELQQMVKES